MGGVGGGIGLVFRNSWWTKAVFGSVGFITMTHNFYLWEYGIPTYYTSNAVFWPWWERRMQLKRMGMDPDHFMPLQGGPELEKYYAALATTTYLPPPKRVVARQHSNEYLHTHLGAAY